MLCATMFASTRPPDGPNTVRRVAVVLVAIAISSLFLWMIRDFLIALLLAAIIAGGVRPIYRRLVRRLHKRPNVAAGLTVAMLALLVIVPLIAFGIVVANQAIDMGRAVNPWVHQQLSSGAMESLFQRYPQLSALRPYRDQILQKAGELGAGLGTFLVQLAGQAAQQLLELVLFLFVMLYATFYFLVDGPVILRKVLLYSPLPAEDEDKLLGRFLSVARATVKGTLVIGAAQGALGGVAFWAAGIAGAAFWATVMGLLSVIPGLGSALVWVPGVVYLLVMGKTGAALALTLWCALIVGSVDNFLRPWLVGKDTKLPDLMILLSTLGGIVLFGPLGFIIGPIVAALFVTVWDIYGDVFRGLLPEPSPMSSRFSEPPPSLTPPPPEQGSPPA
jgi:predicted PurR-regulated permease PerM